MDMLIHIMTVLGDLTWEILGTSATTGAVWDSHPSGGLICGPILPLIGHSMITGG